MRTRRFAHLLMTLAFALTLMLSFAPAAHAQSATDASTNAWCYDPYWGWYYCYGNYGVS